MKRVSVYSARDAAQAHLLADLLRAEGIPAHLDDVTANSLWPVPVKVCVSEAQGAQARSIVDKFERSGRSKVPPRAAGAEWKCPACGELIEPQFTDCWNCQTPRPPRPDPGDPAVAPAVEIPRPPPDPAVPIDVQCLRCQYNLRTLPIDGRCPECGHPVFPSVLLKLRSIDALTDETTFSADVLHPCLDWFEQHFGFPVEAIACAEFVARNASYPDVESFAAAMQQRAVEFFGDSLIAQRALERWNLRTRGNVARLITVLVDLRVIALTADESAARSNAP